MLYWFSKEKHHRPALTANVYELDVFPDAKRGSRSLDLIPLRLQYGMNRVLERIA